MDLRNNGRFRMGVQRRGVRMQVDGPGGGGGIVTLIQDAFTDTDGTALTAHVIAPVNVPGVSWTNLEATATPLTITSNRAQVAGSGVDAKSVLVNAGLANAILSASFFQTAVGVNSNPGLIVRVTDVNNYWLLRLFAGNFELVERVAGVNTTRATAAVTMTNGVVYPVTMNLNGAIITATYNGVTQISYGSATFNQLVTSHGLRLVSVSAGIVYADNFQVTSF